MKNLLLLTLLSFQIAKAQTSELIEASNGLALGELTLIDSNLYRGGLFQEVARIDITDATYPIEVIATGSSNSSTFFRSTTDADQQNVYLADVDGFIYQAPIIDGVVINLTPLIDNDVSATGLAIEGDTLYFVTATSQFVSLNINNPENTLALVYDPPTALPIYNIHIVGDYLYYSTQSAFEPPFDGQVFRLDITISNPQPELVTVTSHPIWTFASIGNLLYLGSTQNNTISRVNLEDTLPTTEAIVFTSMPVDPLDVLFSIEHDGSFLYFSSDSGIYKVEDQVLSNTTPIIERSSISPNPVSTALHINGVLLENTHYSIYNTLGQVIVNDKILLATTIDFSRLENGVYFLELKNGKSVREILRFIKK